MAVEILKFGPKHQTGVQDLIVSIQQNEFGVPITLDAQPDLKNIADFYQHGSGDFWVALDGGVVIGTTALLDIGNLQTALRKMFVSVSHRGQKGVANLLLQTAFDHAKSQDVGEIFLGTTAKFLAAHRFYEKHGFELVDAHALPKTFPRMEVDTRFYRLEV